MVCVVSVVWIVRGDCVTSPGRARSVCVALSFVGGGETHTTPTFEPYFKKRPSLTCLSYATGTSTHKVLQESPPQNDPYMTITIKKDATVDLSPFLVRDDDCGASLLRSRWFNALGIIDKSAK